MGVVEDDDLGVFPGFKVFLSFFVYEGGFGYGIKRPSHREGSWTGSGDVERMSGVEGEMREPFERFCRVRVELELGDLDAVGSREDGREAGERVLPGDG